MSAKGRHRGTVLKQRLCAFCQAGISELRPVFLVTTPSGRIVGPYHAGCAERIHLQSKREGYADILTHTYYGHFTLPAREETLPW